MLGGVGAWALSWPVGWVTDCLSVPLPQEQEQLYLRSGTVSSATFEQPSRQVKLWVKMVTPLIKNFF